MSKKTILITALSIVTITFLGFAFVSSRFSGSVSSSGKAGMGEASDRSPKESSQETVPAEEAPVPRLSELHGFDEEVNLRKTPAKQSADKAKSSSGKEKHSSDGETEEFGKKPDMAYLQVSSLDKDLRIRILSEEGYRIVDVPWEISVVDSNENVIHCEDTDEDGIVILSGLKSGKYRVSLKPGDSYDVPPGHVTAKVRDSILYSALPDIMDFVKTEDEIDAAKEDTAFHEEVDEGAEIAFDEGVTGFMGMTGESGIDVSKYNKDIDWDAVYASGVRFAIIRCGYRGSSTGSLVVDPYWEQNLAGARAAGVKVGVYFFTQAVTEAEAVEEASMVAALLGDVTPEYPVFMDVEGSGGRADGLDNWTRTSIINAFLRTTTAAGYEAGVYANKHWFTNFINTNDLQEGCIKWLAQYNVTGPTYEGNYHMWQYSSKGIVPGIEGAVDLNQSYIER